MHSAEALKVHLTCHTLMFSEAVMPTPFPDNFRMPNIALYDSKGHPAAHV